MSVGVVCGLMEIEELAKSIAMETQNDNSRYSSSTIITSGFSSQDGEMSASKKGGQMSSVHSSSGLSFQGYSIRDPWISPGFL